MAGAQEEPARPMNCTSLAQLRQALFEPLQVHVPAGGQIMALRCTPLTAAQKDVVLDHLRHVLPPKVKDPDGTVRYDDGSEEYRHNRAAAWRKARALVAWFGCPVLRDGRDLVTPADEVTRLLQTEVDDTVLNTIWAALIGDDGGRLQEFLDFT